MTMEKITQGLNLNQASFEAPKTVNTENLNQTEEIFDFTNSNSTNTANGNLTNDELIEQLNSNPDLIDLLKPDKDEAHQYRTLPYLIDKDEAKLYTLPYPIDKSGLDKEPDTKYSELDKVPLVITLPDGTEKEIDIEARLESVQKELEKETKYGKKLENMPLEELVAYESLRLAGMGTRVDDMNPIAIVDGISQVRYGEYIETTITTYNGKTYYQLSEEERFKVDKYNIEHKKWERAKEDPLNTTLYPEPTLDGIEMDTETRVKKADSPRIQYV